eukprot:gene17529-19970_t
MDKQTISAILKIIVSIGGIIWAMRNAPKGATNCPEDWVVTPRALSMETILRPQFHRAECFFPQNYEHGSKNFLDAATAAGAEVRSLPIGLEDLHTDVAIFRKGADPNKFLVHISGAHGPESYIGSAVQNVLLQYIKMHNLYSDSTAEVTSTNETQADVQVDGSGESTPATDEVAPTPTDLPPTLVFVHALNPFGFKHHRRVNEDNVDLNRNFLTPEERQYVDSLDPNYARHIDFKDIINPTERPFSSYYLNDLYAMVQSGYLVWRHGMHTLKTALVAGNYINPKGYSYGGRDYTASARNLIQLIIEDLQLPSRASKLALIDVHTGLGPAGVDTLLGLDAASADAAELQKASDLIEKHFPTEVNHKKAQIGGLKPASSQAASAEGDLVNKGYELTKGTVTGSFCSQMLGKHLSNENKMCITQEFGTVSPMTVGLTMIADNYAYHYGSEEEKAYYANKVKNSFYTETKDWKRRTVHRGLMVFFQAFEYLRKDE